MKNSMLRQNVKRMLGLVLDPSKIIPSQINSLKDRLEKEHFEVKHTQKTNMVQVIANKDNPREGVKYESHKATGAPLESNFRQEIYLDLQSHPLLNFMKFNLARNSRIQNGLLIALHHGVSTQFLKDAIEERIKPLKGYEVHTESHGTLPEGRLIVSRYGRKEIEVNEPSEGFNEGSLFIYGIAPVQKIVNSLFPNEGKPGTSPSRVFERLKAVKSPREKARIILDAMNKGVLPATLRERLPDHAQDIENASKILIGLKRLNDIPDKQ